MLRKSDIKACLNGEYTPIAPAYFFWLDIDFEEAYKIQLDNLHKHFENDFIHTYPKLQTRAVAPNLTKDVLIDEWGCIFGHAETGVGGHPAEPIINNLDEWEEYKALYMPVIEPGVFENDSANIVSENPDRYVTMTIWRTFYERMYMLYGMENLWASLAQEDDMLLSLLNDLKEYTIKMIKAAKVANVDAVYLADDWGMQDRLQISPTAWRKHFKPAYADMIDEAHSLGMDVWMHSCGRIDELIPDFISISLDVIGNLQATAVNLKELSERYRGKITFYGGINVQSNLVYGTPDSINHEIEMLTQWFMPSKGNFIYSPSTTIMPEAPIDNVEILFKAVDHHRRIEN